MPATLLAPLVGLAAFAAWVVGFAPYRLQRSHVRAPVRGLPRELAGYRLAVLADLHHWPGVTTGHVERAVALAMEARPDLVVLLGDYSVSTEKRFRGLSRRIYARALRELEAPLRALHAPDGVVAVLGNHDHYVGAEMVVDWLPRIGARLLRNDAILVRRGDATLVVGGVDDWFEGEVDPFGGAGSMPNDAPTVVLSHVPDGVTCLDRARRVDLVLSGHTHGGQFVVPGWGAPVTFSQVATRRAPAGWVPNDRAPLWVSRGVGVQMPGRFNAPAEVAIVELVPE